MTRNRQIEEFEARLNDFESHLEVLGGVDAINARIESIADRLFCAKRC